MADYSTTIGVFQSQVGEIGDILLKFEQKKWRIRLRPSGLRRDKERGIRHERSEVSVSIADLW